MDEGEGKKRGSEGYVVSYRKEGKGRERKGGKGKGKGKGCFVGGLL